MHFCPYVQSSRRRNFTRATSTEYHSSKYPLVIFLARQHDETTKNLDHEFLPPRFQHSARSSELCFSARYEKHALNNQINVVFVAENFEYLAWNAVNQLTNLNRITFWYEERH